MSDFMTDLAQSAESIDQDSIEQNGPQFPTIQWHYGDNKLKRVGGFDYHGGWFVPKETLDLTGVEGWEACTWTHNEKDETEGFYSPAISLALLRKRSRYEVRNGIHLHAFAMKDGELAKSKGKRAWRLHYLAMVKGLEEYGPFIITLKNTSAVAFTGARDTPGAIPTFERTVITAANAQLKKAGVQKRMAYRAFWLTVGINRDEKGNPVFTERGQGNEKVSLVIPTAYGLPKRAEDAEIESCYVGKENLPRFNEFWDEASTWAEAWKDIQPGAAASEKDKDAAKDEEPAEDVSETADKLGL